MSDDVVTLLLSLLDQAVLSGADPDIEKKAATIAKARQELKAQRNQDPRP